MSSQPPLIVFSHANSFPAGTYGVLFRSLRARGFTVKAVEKFGHDARGVLLLDSPLLGGWRARTLGLVKLTQLVGSASPGRVSRRRRY